MRTKHMGLVLALALTAAACDDSATGPSEGRAEVQVTIQGSDERASSSVTPAGRSFSRSGSDVQGEIDVRARVFVQSTGGRWIELTRQAAQSTVKASGEAGAELLTTSQVESGSYRRVRVEFEEVRAEGLIGVQIGLGGAKGSVRVDTGSDGTVTVEREVGMRAEKGSTHEIRINLNADQWLSSRSDGSETVSEAEFRSAVTVTAR